MSSSLETWLYSGMVKLHINLDILFQIKQELLKLIQKVTFLYALTAIVWIIWQQTFLV